MRYIALSYLIVAIFGFLSCSHSKEKEQLTHAEAIMMEHPDSALSLLRTIDGASIRSESNRALYAILLSQAMDKTYEYTTNDSLISIAIRYYNRTNDTYRKMLAQYYYGRVKFHAEDYPLAIAASLQARDYARQIDDKFWMGMSSRAISDIYHETFNQSEELAYAEDECRFIKESGRQPFIDYAILDLARAHCCIGNYDKSILLCTQLLDSASLHNDAYLQAGAKRLIGLCHLTNDNYAKSRDIFESICRSKLTEDRDTAYLCLSYIGCNQTAKAQSILNQTTINDSLMNSYILYNLYAKQGQTRPALSELEIVDSLTNKILREKISQDITRTAVNHFALGRQQAEKERDSSRLMLWGIIIAAIFSVSGISALFFSHYKSQQAKIEQNVVIAQQLQESLMAKESDYSKAHTSIQTLLSSRYQIFDDLCKLVYESNNTATARKRISDSVTSLIKQMTFDPEIIQDLETMVNEHYSNLMADFRKDLPLMAEPYYRLFLFSVLGFSDSTISLFLEKEKTSMIWSLRRHLKDKIKQIDKEKQSRYLKELS